MVDFHGNPEYMAQRGVSASNEGHQWAKNQKSIGEIAETLQVAKSKCKKKQSNLQA